MKDEELFNWIQHIVNQPALDTTSFKGHVVDTAAFAMGVCSGDPYANFVGELRPWSRALQIGRLMHAFYDAPSPISVAIAMSVMEKFQAEPHQVRDNLIRGFGFTMSDYTYRIFKGWTEGMECQTTRTYHVLKNLLQIAEIRRILTTPNMSIDLDSVQYSIGYANMVLMPMCNESVDAHPVAREMLRRYIEEVQRLIQPRAKDVA